MASTFAKRLRRGLARECGPNHAAISTGCRRNEPECHCSGIERARHRDTAVRASAAGPSMQAPTCSQGHQWAKARVGWISQTASLYFVYTMKSTLEVYNRTPTKGLELVEAKSAAIDCGVPDDQSANDCGAWCGAPRARAKDACDLNHQPPQQRNGREQRQSNKNGRGNSLSTR